MTTPDKKRERSQGPADPTSKEVAHAEPQQPPGAIRRAWQALLVWLNRLLWLVLLIAVGLVAIWVHLSMNGWPENTPVPGWLRPALDWTQIDVPSVRAPEPTRGEESAFSEPEPASDRPTESELSPELSPEARPIQPVMPNPPPDVLLGLGSPCVADAECDAGLCWDTGGGARVCSELCVLGARAEGSDTPAAESATCPTGWECRLGAGGSAAYCVCEGPMDERCDGVDQDCDGVIDEGIAEAVGCAANEQCADAECRCPADALCGNGCQDLQNDRENCGGCGVVCPPDIICVEGRCGCPEGTDACGQQCADLSVDDAHCGQCGQRCLGEASCTAGECGCEQGILCGSACTEVEHNPANCGGCGHVCEVACSGGECARSIDVAIGQSHTCAVLEDGSVRCFGSNDHGQLGESRGFVRGLNNVVHVELGADYSCALRADGSVWCWGRNDAGQLGAGSPGDRATARPVPGIMGALQLTVGRSHACARLADSTLRCWGDDRFGQVSAGQGDANTNANTTQDGVDGAADTPEGVRQPVGIGPVLEVRAGRLHTCVRRLDGRVRCFGDDRFGQLGRTADGMAVHVADAAVHTAVHTDKSVSGVSRVIGLAAGDDHTCALLASGVVSCWGRSDHGQLGVDHLSEGSLRSSVSGLEGVTALSAGARHTCAVLLDGRVYCWGGGGAGQLGDGRLVDRPLPVTARGILQATGIAAGGRSSCVLDRTGNVACWGSGSDGQLGRVQLSSQPTAAPIEW